MTSLLRGHAQDLLLYRTTYIICSFIKWNRELAALMCCIWSNAKAVLSSSIQMLSILMLFTFFTVCMYYKLLYLYASVCTCLGLVNTYDVLKPFKCIKLGIKAKRLDRQNNLLAGKVILADFFSLFSMREDYALVSCIAVKRGQHNNSNHDTVRVASWHGYANSIFFYLENVFPREILPFHDVISK